MMTNEELKAFIDTYKDYYFKVNEEEKDKKFDKEYGKEVLGVIINKPVDKKVEERIMGFLKQGEQNIETIAWKMGEEKYEDKIKHRKYEFLKANIDDFCKEAKEADLAILNNKEISNEELYNDYNILLNIVNKNQLTGYGSVYIISSMFFLSKGRVPIYDYFAHAAVKALLDEGVCPQAVFVGQAPGKEEHAKGDNDKKLAINMLIEYQKLLGKLAEGTVYYKNKEGYISRDLDRALWVYGHATKNYKDILNICSK